MKNTFAKRSVIASYLKLLHRHRGEPGGAYKASSEESPLTHLLPKDEQPFHRCEYSSLKQFAGGLTTVATVGKCCTVTDEFVACRVSEPAAVLK